MKQGRFILMAVAMSSWIFWGQTTSGQELKISLGWRTASPGEEVFVPVDFSVPAEQMISQLVFEVDYPADLLEFQRTELDSNLESDRIEIKTETNPEQVTRGDLRIEVLALEDLPNGSLMDLVFLVNPDITQDRPANIGIVSSSAQTKDGRQISQVTGFGSEVSIQAGPLIFGCFFYMH